jgi:hypothetical protein
MAMVPALREQDRATLEQIAQVWFQSGMNLGAVVEVTGQPLDIAMSMVEEAVETLAGWMRSPQGSDILRVEAYTRLKPTAQVMAAMAQERSPSAARAQSDVEGKLMDLTGTRLAPAGEHTGQQVIIIDSRPLDEIRANPIEGAALPTPKELPG